MKLSRIAYFLRCFAAILSHRRAPIRIGDMQYDISYILNLIALQLESIENREPKTPPPSNHIDIKGLF